MYSPIRARFHWTGSSCREPRCSQSVRRSQSPCSRIAEFKTLVESVRKDYFQRDPAGAKFIDHSRLMHGEFNYNFADMIDIL